MWVHGLRGLADHWCSTQVLNKQDLTGPELTMTKLPLIARLFHKVNDPPPLLSSSSPASCTRSRFDASAEAATMAPQLDSVKRILIQSLLTQDFDSQIIASEASCSVRTVQRIKSERQQSDMPALKTTRAGRRSRMTSAMQKALLDILVKQPYMYRSEMENFLYRHFKTRISECSISRTLRSIGWTRKTIRHIA